MRVPHSNQLLLGHDHERIGAFNAAHGLDKIILVSGDGDYKLLVDFLIEENRFEKILFPNRDFRSSLYKKLSNKYFAYLDDKDIKKKICRVAWIEKGALGKHLLDPFSYVLILVYSLCS